MYQEELNAIIYIIKNASSIILDGYHNGTSSSFKEDGSIVTNVDKEADKLIREYLNNKFPTYGLLTEESKDDLSRLDKEYVWIVDPIDGTLEYVRHQYEFVTNIALVRNHEVVVGVIYAPLTDELFYAIKDEGSYLIKDNKINRIHVSIIEDKLRVLTSPYHEVEEEKEYLEKYKDKFVSISYGGAAYKACLIASGKAEASYRFSPNSKEWDIAAPDIIVREAGGVFYDKYRKRFIYNKKDVRNLDGFIMVNKEKNYF